MVEEDSIRDNRLEAIVYSWGLIERLFLLKLITEEERDAAVQHLNDKTHTGLNGDLDNIVEGE